jgi:hypothetical protein
LAAPSRPCATAVTAAAAHATIAMRCRMVGRSTKRACARIASSQKSVESTSLRSVTHATDSTWSGCRAKTAATNALGHTSPVARRSATYTSAAFAACSAALTAWCPAAEAPNSWQSTISESHVSGIQKPRCVAPNAHAIPARVSPARTTGFAAA